LQNFEALAIFFLFSCRTVRDGFLPKWSDFPRINAGGFDRSFWAKGVSDGDLTPPPFPRAEDWETFFPPGSGPFLAANRYAWRLNSKCFSLLFPHFSFFPLGSLNKEADPRWQHPAFFCNMGVLSRGDWFSPITPAPFFGDRCSPP